jgi:endonuclease-3
MTKKQKAAEIANLLEFYFPEVPVPLDHRDPYTLLVSVLLSAQCTDERVNQVTPHLFELADNPRRMVLLDVDQIREIIKPCGLSPTKSKAIHLLSEILIEKHSGEVPAEIEALEQLPGVGHKTASVVMAQAFGIPAFPVDTHIHRLAWRWGLSTGKNVEKTEYDLKKLFPIETWNKLHLQIIYFARKYCPARGHEPLSCPICSIYGRKELFKEMSKRKGNP